MADQNWLNDLNQDPDLGRDRSDIDELIKSTKEELNRSDYRAANPAPPPERMEPIRRAPQQKPEPIPSQEPKRDFELRIPEIYADLTLEEEEEEVPKKIRKRLPAGIRVLIYVVCVIVSSVLLAMFGWECANDVLALSKPDRNVTITVAPNDTVDEVTQKLKDSGLIEHKWLFDFYCWFSHAEEKLDPGTYELNNRYDYHALVNGMAGTSNRATVSVIIPEGYESEQIFKALADRGVCTVEELRHVAAYGAFDYGFLKNLPYGQDNRLEGYLFPDTYEFFVGDDAERVLNKFLNNFDKKFSAEMVAQIDTLNTWLRERLTAEGFSEAEIEKAMMDQNKIVTVASLIEKETASVTESSTISSVIYNRLCSDQYPCLQIDATIQYALDERKENLSAADLAINSPYNTYTNPGLPVGPISNPGLASIRAALNPEETTYYFYALDKDGMHHFSETYFEHNQFLEQLKNDTDS